MFKRLLAAAVAALLVTACQQTPPPNKFPPIRFADREAYMLDVGAVEITETYKSPMATPNVEHLFPTSPATAMKDWFTDRLKSRGNAGLLRAEIKEASVVEVPLKVSEGVKGAFTKEQAARYDAKMEVSLRIYGKERLVSDAEVSVTVSRSRTLPEKTTLAEKDEFFHRLTEDMMKDFNAEMERELPRRFGNYVLYQ